MFAFVGFFVPVWWWSRVTVDNDRFDTDHDARRVFTQIQRMGAAAMAMGVHDALHGAGFALASGRWKVRRLRRVGGRCPRVVWSIR